MPRAASRSSGHRTIRYDAGIAASCSAYHVGLLVLPTRRVVAASTGSSRPRERRTHGATVSRALDVVLPADGEVLLEQGDRVEVGGWGEGVVEHLDPADPVYPVGPPGVRGVEVAQQVPAAVAYDDRPRVDLGDPLRAGLGAIAEPHPSLVGAGLYQGTRRPGVGAGGGAVGGGRRAPAYRLGLGAHRLRQRPHDLAERAADRVGGIAGAAGCVLQQIRGADLVGAIRTVSASLAPMRAPRRDQGPG